MNPKAIYFRMTQRLSFFKLYCHFFILLLAITIQTPIWAQDNCSSAVRIKTTLSEVIVSSNSDLWLKFYAECEVYNLIVDRSIYNNTLRYSDLFLYSGNCTDLTEKKHILFDNDSVLASFSALQPNQWYYVKLILDPLSTFNQYPVTLDISLIRATSDLPLVTGFCTPDTCYPANLAENGNFDTSGVAPVPPHFYSDYQYYNPYTAILPGRIYINDNVWYSAWNTSVTGVQNSTTTNGNFLICDGDTGHPGTKQVIWGQNINVLPNTSYYYSFYIHNLAKLDPYSSNYIYIKFDINGVSQELSNLNTHTASITQSQGWVQVCGFWSSSDTDTIATLDIYIDPLQLISCTIGNDLGIDEIVFSRQSFHVECADRLICAGDSTNIGYPITITGNNGPFVYYWDFSASGSATPNYIVSTSVPEVYHLQVINSETHCFASTNVFISIFDTNQIQIVGNNNSCDSLSSYSVLYTQALDSIKWEIYPPNSGIILQTQQSTYPGLDDTVNIAWYNSILPEIPLNAWLIVKAKPKFSTCEAIDSIKIFQCCIARPGNLNELFLNNTTISSPTSFPSGSNYTLNGTLTIKNSVDLHTTQLFMGPEARIVIENDSFPFGLNIETSNIEAGCPHMWDGIYVLDTSNFIQAKNSDFRDAKNGIVSENGGYLTLWNNQFYNNYFSIRINNRYLRDSKDPFGSANWHITGNIFSNINFSNALLIAPDSNYASFAGIDVVSVDSLIIGHPDSTANSFNSMRWGIKALDACLTIYNADFTNITFSDAPIDQPPTTSDIFGAGIEAISSTGVPFNTRLWANGNTQYGINFNTCKTGISTINQKTSVLLNSFTDCNEGIKLKNTQSPTKISWNLITSSDPALVIPGTAIYCGNVLNPIEGADLTIEHNTIQNIQNGISLENVNGLALNNPKVLINTIHLKYVPDTLNNYRNTGINIQGCDYAYIYANEVNNGNYSPHGYDTAYCRGLRIAYSRYALAKLNHINRCGSGIFTNGPLNNTRFICNTLNNCYHGFYFGFGTTLSNQGYTGNKVTKRWIPNNYFGGTYDVGSPFQGKFGQKTPNITNITPVLWFFKDDDLVAIQLDSNLNSNTPYHPSYDKIQGVINNSVPTYCTFPSPVNPTADSSYILRIIRDTLDREEQLGRILREDDLYSIFQEQYHWYEKEYLLHLIVSDTSILGMGGYDDAEYVDVYHMLLNSDQGQLLEISNHISRANLEEARLMNEALSGSALWVDNLQRVNRIYIDTWAKNKFLFTEAQRDDLQAIALTIPYENGPAVYMARVMLGIDSEEYLIPYNIPIKNPVTVEKTLILFPNPAKDVVYIQTTGELGQGIRIEFYNLVGSLVLTKPILNTGNNYSVSIKELPSGTYFCKLLPDNNKVKLGKLVIIR